MHLLHAGDGAFRLELWLVDIAPVRMKVFESVCDESGTSAPQLTSTDQMIHCGLSDYPIELCTEHLWACSDVGVVADQTTAGGEHRFRQVARPV